MDGSDKCANNGLTAIRKDFFGSLTGQYVDITFKTMGVMTVLMAALAAPLLYLLYQTGGTQAVYRSLYYLGPVFVGVYAFGYYWVYQNIYTPVHEISTRLLAEQDSIDAWPDSKAAEGKDILNWSYMEIEKLLEAVIELQKEADKIRSGDLDVKQMKEMVSNGHSFEKAAEEIGSDLDTSGQMVATFDQMATTMRKLAYQAHCIANGDLTNDSLDNEIDGDLGIAFQKMITNIKTFTVAVQEEVNKVRSISDEVDNAAAELSQASQQLSQGAQESAASLEETSSSIEEMASMIDQTNDNSDCCHELTQEAVEIVKKGKKQVQSMVETMEAIDENSEEIAEAIEVIDDIAFQTNLLALNAAVEAANAGEHGDGFAVVADEVQDLAQRSANAAEDVQEVVERSISQIEEGAEQAHRSRDVLDNINEKVNEVKDRVDDVSAAQDEQTGGTEEINRAITELEEVTNQNTAKAEQTASASDELSAQANGLEETVQQLSKISQKFNVDIEEKQVGRQPTQNTDDTESYNSKNAGSPQTKEDVIPLDEDEGGF